MEQLIEKFGWVPSIVMGGVTFILLILVIIRLQQSINRISNNSRRTAIDSMRKTSKHNKKENGRKVLTFDDNI